MDTTLYLSLEDFCALASGIHTAWTQKEAGAARRTPIQNQYTIVLMIGTPKRVPLIWRFIAHSKMMIPPLLLRGGLHD